MSHHDAGPTRCPICSQDFVSVFLRPEPIRVVGARTQYRHIRTYRHADRRECRVALGIVIRSESGRTLWPSPND